MKAPPMLICVTQTTCYILKYKTWKHNETRSNALQIPIRMSHGLDIIFMILVALQKFHSWVSTMALWSIPTYESQCSHVANNKLDKVMS